MIKLTNFQKTLKNLITYHEIYRQKLGNATVDEQKMDKTATIHAFTLCYEMAINALKHYLLEELGVDAGVGGKLVLKHANQSSLLDNSIERWLSYVDYRHTATHVYAEEKIDEIMELIPSFIEDATKLYETMSKEKWA